MANEKRLIDPHDLWTDIMMLPHNGDMISSEEVEQTIKEAPTVDAVEVVHGRWIKYRDEKFVGYDADGRIKYRNVYSYNCDKCGHGTAVKSNYCPACGAKMEGVKEVGY